MGRLKVTVLGAGNRGGMFAELMQERKDEFEIAAICDTVPEQLLKCKKILGIPDEMLFSDPEVFFEKKRGDIMVIATYDRDHVKQAVKAMELGYDILLEKPISDSREEIKLLLDTQKKTGSKVVVCHELRFGGAFAKLKELLDQGVIGRLLAIDAMERVFYWHFAQAYVRIQSGHNHDGHPIILAKCSHDLDLVQSYAGAKCDTVSSVGGLSFFRAGNEPEGATERCIDCPHIETCPYSAKRVYIDRWHELGEPEYIWPFNKVSLKMPTTEEHLYEGIRNTYFGKCVFKCNNEHNEHVVDNQMVQMKFANGVIATQKMLFAGNAGRRINLFGTYGELVLDERADTIEVWRFGEKTEVIQLKTLNEQGHNHGGGDNKLVSELYDIYTGKKPNITSLEESVESHLIGISAEESRLAGGIEVKVHKDI